MFCFQCQETALNTDCTVKGVCGKEPRTAGLVDVLLYAVQGEAIVNRALRSFRYSTGGRRSCSMGRRSA